MSSGTFDWEEALRPLAENESQLRTLVDLASTAIDTALVAWPDLCVGEDAFGRHIVRHLPTLGAAEALTELHAADLYLACACLGGDPTALSSFEATYDKQMALQLRRFGLSEAEQADVAQQVRVKLFVGGDGADPLIGDYAGRGSLSSWLRAVTVHAGLKAKRSGRRRDALERDALLRMAPDTVTTPELAHLKTTYAESFSDAFAVAMQELDVEDRVLLRQRLIDHLSIDDLAPLYGAHRATVARRITRARARLVARSKEIMSERLGLGPGTLDSIVRMIRSQLDISIVRRLREGSDSSPG